MITLLLSVTEAYATCPVHNESKAREQSRTFMANVNICKCNMYEHNVSSFFLSTDKETWSLI